MACMQQYKASCESDYSEKEKIHVSQGSQGCYQAVGAHGHGHSSSAHKHPSHTGHSSGHHGLIEKVAGLYGSNKGHGHHSSGCNTSGHHNSSSQASYEFEEKEKMKSCKSGHKKSEKKIKKKSSYKRSSSDSSDSDSDKEHC